MPPFSSTIKNANPSNSTWISIAVLLFAPACSSSFAGIGPENLVVVVNADSEDSRTIANHYIHLRQIPSRNVVYLTDVPQAMVTTLDSFREKILTPLLNQIDSRGLSNQIRAVAYSSNFPYAVNIQPHHDRLTDKTARKIYTPVASINGLTYYFRFMTADREEYLSPTSNLYARLPFSRNFINPFTNEDAKQFDDAKSAMDADDFTKAQALFLELFQKYPTQTPLAVLAARAFALDLNPDAAMGQLSAAVEAGWTSATAFDEDPSLESLRERSDFRKLVSSLSDAPDKTQHAVAFETTRSWTPNGWWIKPDQGGISYLPSCMLAVTRGAGNSVPEAIDYLTSAASADHTFPKGTFYFASTSDVRTTTRLPNMADAIAHLRTFGHSGKIIKTAIPDGEKDVLGITFGVANYDWPKSANQFVPGAIGDNLTSTSGVMTGSGQTALSALLRGGAAIASGTVTEPYALQFKFPLPQIHAFYAQGLTAIESYYLSVSSPYQLLIVGDPLCQPFARPPAESINAQLTNRNGKKAIVLSTNLPEDAASKSSRSTPMNELEFYIDGKLVNRTIPQDNYTLELSGLVQGSHELRTVLIGEPQSAPRKSIVAWLDANGLFPIPTTLLSNVELADGKRTIRIGLQATGADSIRLMHFDQEAGVLEGDEGELSIDLSPFGDGPIRLQPVASFRGTDVAGREFTTTP